MTKINLIQVKGNSFFCDALFSVGVYLKNNVAILIDSGITTDFAKELNKTFTEANIQVAAIITTHSHGDHCGGNAFFQKKYPGLKVFSTEIEKPFIEDPLMIPSAASGGAAPFQALRKSRPLTVQQPSKVTDLIAPYQDQTITVCAESFEIFTLPGHARGMIGVKTTDGVLYAADALFGDEIFNKYAILYYTSIGETLHSLQRLKNLVSAAAATVIYHGGLISDPLSLIEKQEKRIFEIKERLLSLLRKQPLSLDELTAAVMQENNIPDDLLAYTLTRIPLQAYLADFESNGVIEMKVTAGVNRAHLIAVC